MIDSNSGYRLYRKYYWDKIGPGKFSRSVRRASEYLGELPKSRDQYYTQSFIGGAVPLIGGYYNARDSVAQMDDYIRNRGLSYANIRYPSKTIGYSGVSSFGSSSMSFISSNVSKLYR